MRMLRAAVTLCCAGSILAPAAAEAAGTVSAGLDGTDVFIDFQAAAGVENDMTVVTAAGSIVLSDTADTINVATGSQLICAGGGTNTVTCTNPNIVFATTRLGDMNDGVVASGTVSFFADAGTGNDEVTATNSSDTTRARVSVSGDEGNDTIVTGDGDDNAGGGPGTDSLSMGNGDDSADGDIGDGDRVDLGPGDDRSNLNAADGAGDVAIGGPGLDSLSMGPTSFPPPPIDIVLDLEAGTVGGTNVGAATVTGFEDVDLFGHRSTNVRGTPGQNVITTREGADTVDPGAGSDFINLSAGDDHALARDGFPDLVRCGPGNDTAQVDQTDLITDCEQVDLAEVPVAGVPTGPPDCAIRSFRARVARGTLLKRGLRVRVRCATPTALEVRLLGRAKRRGGGVGVARAGDVVLAERALRLGDGTRSVPLRIAKKLRAGVPRSTRLLLVVIARDEFGNARRLTKTLRVTAARR